MNQPPGSRFGSAVVTLPSATQIQITRVFDAPAEIVFKAWTTPELVRRWWGSPENPLTVCDIDLRVGGNWRYAMVMGDAELGWHGTYQAIDAPELFDRAPDQLEGSITIGDVHRRGEMGRVQLIQFGNEIGKALDFAGRRHNGGAPGGEMQGDPPSHSFGRPRHDDHFSPERVAHHGFPHLI